MTPVRQAGEDADPAVVAETLVERLRGIDQALAPVIGRRGVTALYARTVHLSSQEYPWLAGIHEVRHTTMDLVKLQAVVTQQTRVDADAGAKLLLQNFHELVASFLGPSLTERLLRSGETPSFLSGPPV